MRSITLTAILATLVFVAGCGEKKRLENELAAAQGQIVGLRDSLQLAAVNTGRLADSLTGEVQKTKTVNDSLSASLKKATARAGRLESDLRSTKEQLQQTIGDLGRSHARLDSLTRAHRDLQLTLESTEAQLTDAQEKLLRAQGQRDSLLAFVDGVRPWFDYYKHESKRNWAKKLFGAGRAKKPTTTEPEFPRPTTPMYEVERP